MGRSGARGREDRSFPYPGSFHQPIAGGGRWFLGRAAKKNPAAWPWGLETQDCIREECAGDLTRGAGAPMPLPGGYGSQETVA